MRDYAARKAARIERMKARAVGKHAEAERLRTKNDALLGVMNSTPILIGHHSEKRHRRDLARIDNDMRKGFEASKEAERLAHAASAAESNEAISSDDPEAVAKLKAKMERLQAAPRADEARQRPDPQAHEGGDGRDPRRAAQRRHQRR